MGELGWAEQFRGLAIAYWPWALGLLGVAGALGVAMLLVANTRSEPAQAEAPLARRGIMRHWLPALVLLALVVGLGAAFLTARGKRIEVLLTRVAAGMSARQVTAIMGQPDGRSRFTRDREEWVDGTSEPPSMRGAPAHWHDVPVDTTVEVWIYQDASGVGVIYYDSATMQVLLVDFNRRDGRGVPYG